MKTLVFLFCLTALGAAQAQQSASYSAAFDARERGRIALERQTAQQRFSDEEADCYQRFAVNDCLREVRRRRRVAMEELRRQEIVLNDARRSALAAKRQLQVDERSAEAPAQAKDAPADVGASRRPVASEPVNDAARRQRLQRAYDERQREAHKRRETHEREQAGKSGPASKPLPLPP